MMWQQFLIGFCLSAILAFASYKLKFLALSGAVAAFVIGIIVFGFGGLSWGVPIITFFVFSSLLTKYRKGKNEEVEKYFEKSGVRDYLQVISNGGIAAVLVIANAFFPDKLFYLTYLCTIAAVCADTWATEIGTLRKTATYNILSFKIIPQGTSGGISMTGTLGVFLGSILIFLSGLLWMQVDIVLYFWIMISAGFVGSFLDSFLGATVQAQYECSVCGKLTEKKIHCGDNAVLSKGISWFNNDVVNFFCGLAGASTIIVFKSLVKI